MYNVHQHWDPLKVCIVGRSYSPEFYTFIKNLRNQLETPISIYLESYNQICKQITDDAFVHLKGIKKLDMSYCIQDTITHKGLRNLVGIEKIYMYDCRDSLIEAALFDLHFTQ
jgi:hypothetical protein